MRISLVTTGFRQLVPLRGPVEDPERRVGQDLELMAAAAGREQRDQPGIWSKSTYRMDCGCHLAVAGDDQRLVEDAAGRVLDQLHREADVELLLLDVLKGSRHTRQVTVLRWNRPTRATSSHVPWAWAACRYCS